MAEGSIFRDKALAYAANPERMEKALTLLSPRLWLGLLAVLVLMSIAGVWSWYGRIDTKVCGAGIIMNLGGLRPVVAETDGRLKYLNVYKGSKVVQNQVLGVIEMPLLELQIKQLQDKRRLLQDQFKELLADEEVNAALRKEYFSGIGKATEDSISKLEQVRGYVGELSEMHRELRQKGITSKVEFYQALRDTVNAELDVVRQVEFYLKLPLDKFDFGNAQKRLREERLRELILVENEIESKKLELRRHAYLLSPVAGTVANVMHGAGDSTVRGENVFTILPAVFDSMSLTSFFRLKDWKKIHVAQLAFISPLNTEAQRHGYMLGVVRKVGKYPDTEETIERFFQNRDVAKFIRHGEEAVISVEIEFIPDSKNRTGIRWTSGEPEGLEFTPGTPCNVLVVVERRPPISFVLPWLREKFLGTGTVRRID